LKLLRDLLRRGQPDSAEQGPLFDEVRSAMADVKAYARSHGGDIELLGVSEGGDVTIRMAGACRGCPMSALTLKHGIEGQLRQLVPGVGKVIEAK
jgi:Fe-S cluster biogenesis protein NfuA